MASHPRERRARSAQSARLPAQLRDRRRGALGRRQRVARRVREQRQLFAAGVVGRQDRRLRSAAEAQPEEQPRDAAAVQRRDQGRSRAREGHAEDLQLRRLRRARHAQGVREEVRRQGRHHHLRLDGRRGQQAPGEHGRASMSPTCRPTASARSSRPATCSRSTAATSPTSRTSGRRLQDPFYDKGSQYSIPYTLLHDRRGLPRRQDRSGRRPVQAEGRHRPPLQPEVQGPHVGARRRPRSALDGVAAARHHRREHRRPRADRRRRARS